MTDETPDRLPIERGPDPADLPDELELQWDEQAQAIGTRPAVLTLASFSFKAVSLPSPDLDGPPLYAVSITTPIPGLVVVLQVDDAGLDTMIRELEGRGSDAS